MTFDFDMLNVSLPVLSSNFKVPFLHPFDHVYIYVHTSKTMLSNMSTYMHSGKYQGTEFGDFTVQGRGQRYYPYLNIPNAHPETKQSRLQLLQLLNMENGI